MKRLFSLGLIFYLVTIFIAISIIAQVKDCEASVTTTIADFQVNENTDPNNVAQSKPVISADENGNFIVCWHDYRAGNDDIYAQRYDKSGALLGSNFRVNDQSYSYIPQANPAMAVDRGGNFVICWADARNYICAQLYDKNGAAIGPNILVTTNTHYSTTPAVTFTKDNHFVITYLWLVPPHGKSFDVYFQMFNDSGHTIGQPVKVSERVILYYWPFSPPVIGADENGNFTIAWSETHEVRSEMGSRLEHDVYFQKYSCNGAPVGGNITVAQRYFSSPIDLAVDKNGDFGICWNDRKDGVHKILLQWFNDEGVKQGQPIEIEVNSNNARQAIAIDDYGNSVVSWQDFRNGNSDIFAQCFDSRRQKLGEAYKVNNDIGAASQEEPDVSMMNGKKYFAWQDERMPNQNWDIFARVEDFDVPVKADFNSDRNVGPAPIVVKFKNLTTGSADSYEWSFGDHCYSSKFEPEHLYDVPGIYHVSLRASGPGGKDCKYREGFITVYADSGYLYLKLVKGSSTWWEEPWDNAIDGDTWGWDGTATAAGDAAWAIFEFNDNKTKTVDRFRLLSDTGVHFKDRWVQDFRVQVSSTDTLPSNFTTILDTSKVDSSWETFKIKAVSAKYVKLIVDKPAVGWRQIGEFEVWEHIILPDPMLSTIVATSPHYANGLDSSKITLTLKDKTGAPISKRADKIALSVTGDDNVLSKIIEIDGSGIYTATLKSLTPEIKTIEARIHGVAIRYSSPKDSTLCQAEFKALPLVQSTLKLGEHSYAYPGEDWENAIDGVTKGWDGTVTAAGYPPYAIFKFQDEGIHSIQKIRLLTDTGVRFADRWIKRFRLFVSTTGTNSSDFKLILDGYQTTGDWQSYYFVMTDAKYVKLVIDEPNTTWRQLGEFEVYEMKTIGPLLAEKSLSASAENNMSLIPDHFALLSNYPNPFNPETTIRFDLAEDAKVTMVIYNIRGQQVKTLIDEQKFAGRYDVNWNGTNNVGSQVAAGVYLYHITAEYKGQVFSETRRMILLR